MIKLIYSINPEEKFNELEWLHNQKIYPSFSDSYDWILCKVITKIGVITDLETATSIKLRHKVDFQQNYCQR